MAILQDTVKIKITKYNIDHYLSKGYSATNGESIIVKVEDLSQGSGVKILVECDYCHKSFMKSYRDYLRTIGRVCCQDCRKYKFEETNLKRYGVKCSLNNPAIHEKAKNTFMKKYGVEYPLLSQDIRDKCRETCQIRYNSNSYPLNPEDISKIVKRQTKSCGVVSREQECLHEIIGGELNVRIGKYVVDLLFSEQKIACEYNGGGHTLGVIHGNLTMDELIMKDRQKYLFLMKNGFKCFVIENPKYGLPSDDILLKIKQRGFEVLNEQEDICTFIYNIIDNSESLLKINDL